MKVLFYLEDYSLKFILFSTIYVLVLFEKFSCEILGDLEVKNSQGFNFTNVAAAIVEHRPLRNLPAVFENFLNVLPEEVQITFFCSSESSSLVKSKLRTKTNIKMERVIFIENYFGGLASVSMSKRTYNRLILDHTLWSLFFTMQKKVILLFEYDTFLCTNPTKSLNNFIRFGYIGAPWLTRSCKTCKSKRILHAKNKDFLPIPVGNSGLSIMNTGLMLKVTSSFIKKKNSSSSSSNSFERWM